jgi:hypothetical protein
LSSSYIADAITKLLLATLVDLPLETLVEILVLLELRDVLCLRQVRLHSIQFFVLMQLFYQMSKRLHDASLSRPVWLSLDQWHSAAEQPRPFLPEKSLE